MASRGKKPQSRELKVLIGTPDRFKKAAQDPEISAAPTRSKPPAHLGVVAAKEWSRLYGVLRRAGVFMVTDLRTFETYCEIYGRLIELGKLADEVGIDEAIKRGYMKILAGLRTQLRLYSSELGLTPTSRKGLQRGTEKRKATKADKYI